VGDDVIRTESRAFREPTGVDKEKPGVSDQAVDSLRPLSAPVPLLT
jgi:hypothetical protein